MTSDDFRTLSYTDKTEAVLTGTYLAARSDEHYFIKLYNVENFYLEIFFDSRSQLIIHFRAFEHTLFVLPYLEDLKIAV
ncbi:hypothetical protein [Mucilaginibacter flavus]|uniref:hypothetical protein n=1 Tax=Mucilaginibacter flavus TaxID=931504 RepID=UPI0025B30883|nr:hypothetical protein [Mucilaginibacter flavus]MDN3583405.1 hypothetical protein [Mucilaginibacter flavus]